MVKNYLGWKEAVEKEYLKLREVEEYLSEDGLNRLTAFEKLKDLSNWAFTAKEALADYYEAILKHEISNIEQLDDAIFYLRRLADLEQ